MTIGIATISEVGTGNPKIVFCADRLVTDDQGLTFEQGIPKIVAITENCLVIGAGLSTYGDRIILNVINRINIESEDVKKLKIDQIVKLIQEEHKKVRTEVINNEILAPRGLDLAKFYDNIKNFPEWLGMMIDSQIVNYDFDVVFLVLGFDIYDEVEPKFVRAHICEITQNGNIHYFDSMGFAMVGISLQNRRYDETGKWHCGFIERAKLEEPRRVLNGSEVPEAKQATPRHTFIRNNLGSLALHVASEEKRKGLGEEK